MIAIYIIRLEIEIWEIKKKLELGLKVSHIECVAAVTQVNKKKPIISCISIINSINQSIKPFFYFLFRVLLMGLLRKIVNKLFYEYFDIIFMKNIKYYFKKKT